MAGESLNKICYHEYSKIHYLSIISLNLSYATRTKISFRVLHHNNGVVYGKH